MFPFYLHKNQLPNHNFISLTYGIQVDIQTFLQFFKYLVKMMYQCIMYRLNNT